MVGQKIEVHEWGTGLTGRKGYDRVRERNERRWGGGDRVNRVS